MGDKSPVIAGVVQEKLVAIEFAAVIHKDLQPWGIEDQKPAEKHVVHDGGAPRVGRLITLQVRQQFHGPVPGVEAGEAMAGDI